MYDRYSIPYWRRMSCVTLCDRRNSILCLDDGNGFNGSKSAHADLVLGFALVVVGPGIRGKQPKLLSTQHGPEPS